MRGVSKKFEIMISAHNELNGLCLEPGSDLQET